VISQVEGADLYSKRVVLFLLYRVVLSERVVMCHRWCVKVAAALEAAYKQVEAGKMEDHPKQAALQKALIGIQTVQPVGTPFSLLHGLFGQSTCICWFLIIRICMLM